MLNKTTKSAEKPTYSQPKVYWIGSLERVQSGPKGNECDGATQFSYFYV